MAKPYIKQSATTTRQSIEPIFGNLPADLASGEIHKGSFGYPDKRSQQQARN